MFSDHGWLMKAPILWKATGQHPMRYRAVLGDLRLGLYCGYAPLVPPYGLYVNGEESFRVGALPTAWSLGGEPDPLPRLRPS